MFRVWRERVRSEADLCCYWFEKARAQIEAGKCKRAGLLATQGIRGGANRDVLQRIKETGDIFFAESDRDWVLDGANVHISMVGFDSGGEWARTLDGNPVKLIHANLTSSADVTQARPLAQNADIAFMGDTKGGQFDVSHDQAVAFLQAPNPHGAATSQVVVPWVKGLDVTRRPRHMWIVDFGCDMDEAAAASFEGPFEYVRKVVAPVRKGNKR